MKIIFASLGLGLALLSFGTRAETVDWSTYRGNYVVEEFNGLPPVLPPDPARAISRIDDTNVTSWTFVDADTEQPIPSVGLYLYDHWDHASQKAMFRPIDAFLDRGTHTNILHGVQYDFDGEVKLKGRFRPDGRPQLIRLTQTVSVTEVNTDEFEVYWDARFASGEGVGSYSQTWIIRRTSHSPGPAAFRSPLDLVRL